MSQFLQKAFVIAISLLFMGMNNYTFSQIEGKGHYFNRKYGVMDANLCRVPFKNTGRISGALGYELEYPRGSGHQQFQGLAPFIVTRVMDADGNMQAICEDAYVAGGFGDRNEDSGVIWAYEPVGGYAYPTQDRAAMSDEDFTWPDFWPDKMDDATDPGWPGAWNGYFGKGVTNADLETYFVIDDDPDKEFNFYPDANDSTRGGLATEMYIRSLMWANVLTESHCFWLYDVLNEGTTQYDSMYFGLFADFFIGADDDDVAGYNSFLDIAYCYDYDNIGNPGAYTPVPAFCHAYLESPTTGWDGIDNDNDGLYDEERDSGPGQWLFGSIGYYEVSGDFDEEKQETGTTEYYEKWHWSGDEDGDWDIYEDTNENGQYDSGEPLNDDLGEDGIGPFDDAYEGPDVGEGDGIPTDGEPDFDRTDLDEGDQIGLTGFWPGEYGDRKDHSKDDLVWEWCKTTVTLSEDVYRFAGNLGCMWQSGPIKHEVDQRQRFSFSLFYATGPSDVAQVEDAFRKKKTVQKIYNANYRFAEPPKIPTLTAIPGDGKVYLYWDDVAESSFDRFFKVYDFQGYSLYRSTEPTFRDCRLITDGFGTISLKKPIFRCDYKDSLSGFFPGTYNGVQFYIGENTGLRHSYIDEDVTNGQTYYYALASFDGGFIPDSLENPIDILDQSIMPSECLVSIDIDVLNNVESIAKNCAVVVPNAAAAGYDPLDIQESVEHYGPPSDTQIEYQIFNPHELKNRLYRLEFDYPDSSWTDLPYFQILASDNEGITDPDTIQPWTQFQDTNDESDYFDGIILEMEFKKDKEVLIQEWAEGSQCNLDVFYTPGSFPNWDLDIIFTDTIAYTAEKYNRFQRVFPVPFYIYSPTIDDTVHFYITDTKRDGVYSIEDEIKLVFGEKRGLEPEYNHFSEAGNIKFVNFEGGLPVDEDTTWFVRPQPGDVFHIRMNTPPQQGESFEFESREAVINKEIAKNDLDKITVVPNPYVVTERWEPYSPYLAGRGAMEIHFNYLPKNCTIKIFTVQGYLVDTIEHNVEMNNGTAIWDVMTKDNMHIAPGNYIYHVDTPSIGQKIGRFMVIK